MSLTARFNRYRVIDMRSREAVSGLHTYIVALYICGVRNLFMSPSGSLYTLFKVGKVKTLRVTRRTRRDARAHRVTRDA